MRIIGGELKGRKLRSIRGTAIRPTSDRVRESIFNIIRQRVAGSKVLDLFAGTGALGIEALSRGAKTATFVDRSVSSLSIISRNLKSFKVEDRSKTIKWDIHKNLNCLKTLPSFFDLVFMDPPYDMDIANRALENLHKCEALEKEAMIVVEHSPKEKIEIEAPVFSSADERRYGKTLVSFLIYML